MDQHLKHYTVVLQFGYVSGPALETLHCCVTVVHPEPPLSHLLCGTSGCGKAGQHNTSSSSSNNRELAEHFWKLKALYNLKTYTVQIPTIIQISGIQVHKTYES